MDLTPAQRLLDRVVIGSAQEVVQDALVSGSGLGQSRRLTPVPARTNQSR